MRSKMKAASLPLRPEGLKLLICLRDQDAVLKASAAELAQ